MRLYLKKQLNYDEADRLLEQYYDGQTSAEDEKRLQVFLSQKELPSKYHTERAIFGYFDQQKSKRRFNIAPYIRWSTSVAAAVTLLISLNLFLHNPSNTNNYAWVNGQKLTNITEIKHQAMASLGSMSNGDSEVNNQLKEVSGHELINQQISVFSEQQ